VLPIVHALACFGLVSTTLEYLNKFDFFHVLFYLVIDDLDVGLDYILCTKGQGSKSLILLVISSRLDHFWFDLFEHSFLKNYLLVDTFFRHDVRARLWTPWEELP
jgi:hypothetical protein